MIVPFPEVIKDELEKLRESGLKRNEALLKVHSKAIKAEYPVSTEDEILDIIFAKESQAECAECIAKGEHNCIHYNECEYLIDPSGKVSKRRCKKKKLEELNEYYERANIPKRYRHLTLDDYEQDRYNSKAVKEASEAIKQNRGVFIRGECGRGKTMLAAILAQELIQRGKNVYFATASKIARKFKSTPLSEQEQLAEWFGKIPYLVIDDLGAEAETAQIDELLFDIIDDRYNNNSPVIVTTNLNSENEAVTTARKRIFSRLKSTCQEVILQGDDRRLMINLP